MNPRKAMPSEDALAPAASIAASSVNDPISILIVDDEPKNLTVLETVLNDPGYRLVRAGSADEALLALVSDEFALLILDIRMPSMNGFELAQMIKERKKTARVPIIFLTAYFNEDQHVLEGYGAGAVDYLHKPVNPAILRSKVFVFAELFRKNRELELANRALLAEVTSRLRIEEQLRELNATLEQRVAERTQALRENQWRLRHAADAAGLTYAELDVATGEVWKAENFAKVMGYKAPPDQEVTVSSAARLLLDHVVPEDRPRIEGILEKLLTSNVDGKIDYRVIGDDQIERWIESDWSVDLDSQGHPLKSFITNLDVTGRKRGELALRTSNERFRQLADSMPQMVWTALPDGYVDYYNQRWNELTGIEPERLDQIRWEAILHPDDLKNCQDAWRYSLQTGDAYQIEYRLWDRRSKGFRWFLGRALPVRSENGLIVKWFGTCTDIDEQKRIENELRRANRDLEQFSFSASHDLQEPLRNVAVSSQLLKEHYGANLDDKAEQLLGYILEGAQRMSQLVSDLLQYTLAAGLDTGPTVSVDAKTALERVLKNLSSAAKESQAVITYDRLPSVSIREVHLEQLFQNLIANALKYRKAGEGAQVHISTALQGNQWLFSVRDNGIGIAPEHRNQVFGIFKRLHARGDKYPGTGIGLAICQKTVERYGGRIWLDSELGQGTIVHFTVPAVSD